MSEIKKGRYRHYKGKDYLVVGEGTHHETRELMVLYVPLYGDFRIEIRPKDMFLEEVDMPEYHYKGPRFRFIPLEITSVSGEQPSGKNF